ncbi:nuclease EXOG, mitochondrial isoform X3 [Castor canadensis]|uniref:Nuclease EXOG, mitochondrial isoform X3 n=1 Tax=Castor canadensis TaxID=51338 RepID=A0AC58LFL4_CASCN
MAAESFASRLRGSRRILSGFVAGAVVGAAGAGLTALHFFRSRGAGVTAAREPGGSAEKAVLEQFGFPLTGTETRCYTNHALSYDQAKRVPRWVLEHISKSKIMGDADRKHCKFKPDPNIPPTFSALNEDYVGSGWSRGHMAPAGNNKFSSVIGEDNVAVPSHLYKVILARRSPESTEPLALGAFVVPNEAIGFQPQLTEFQVSLQDLEKLSGLVFFPHLDRTSDIRNICSVDTCKLLDFQEFTLYLSTRKIEGARSVFRLEKVMENLKNSGIEPDDYFMSCYEKKLEELRAKEQSGAQMRKPS